MVLITGSSLYSLAMMIHMSIFSRRSKSGIMLSRRFSSQASRTWARSRMDRERVTAPEVPEPRVTGARDALSGLTDGVCALRCVVLADARQEDVEGRREVVARAREGG